MKPKISTLPWCLACLAALLALASPQRALFAADNPGASADQETELIRIITSDAPPQDKAIPCKKLAIYGTKNAVPALAPLLENPELASWARIALEAIPDPAADEAFRDALTKVQGRLLIGVINSIGVRQDAKAVEALVHQLRNSDADIASAAGEALGHIGTAPATAALEQALTSAPAGARASIAYGCILSAEKLLADGKSGDAARLYDKVRRADVPKQRQIEAIRGAILARKSEGIPLLREQLRSADRAFFAIGLRTARELPGRQVTQALADELNQASTERQVLLFQALADRTDEAVLPIVLQLAQNGPRQVRVTALGLLDQFRDLACVPVLLDASAETDAELARAAKASLTRLGGKEIDADLLARLRLSSGKTREILIDLARQRRIDGALPLVMRSTEASDAGVRRAAVEAAGVLGTEQETPALVRLLSTTRSGEEQEDIEAALLALCQRNGARCLPDVLPLAKSGETPLLRKAGLRALASIGGAEALAVVKNAIQDQNQAIQDEAVSVLSTWPNTWPDDTDAAEPLLALASSSQKPAYQAQGLQGYLQFIEETSKLENDQKLARLNDLFASIQKPDQKRQIIAVIGSIPTAAALERLVALAEDETVSEEACAAAVKIATTRNLRSVSREARRNALQTALDKSKNEAIRQRAAEALKRMR